MLLHGGASPKRTSCWSPYGDIISKLVGNLVWFVLLSFGMTEDLGHLTKEVKSAKRCVETVSVEPM